MIKVQLIADSINPSYKRISTFLLTYPRFIHAEMLRHRMLSRSAQSSRAIPVHKIIKSVEENPVIPLHWGLNQSGMQAFNEIDESAKEEAVRQWLLARDKAVEQAKELVKLNIHKQIVNRILEPFSTITEVVTGTDWGNFFNLRVHKDAQPEIKVLAIDMLKLYTDSTPRLINYEDWHLPFIREEELSLDLETRIKVSFTRCARASYVNFYGKNDIGADVKKYDELVSAYHLSPAEHQAQSKSPTTNWNRSEFLVGDKMKYNYSFFDWAILKANGTNVGPFHYYYANFDGWSSRRRSIKGENRRNFNKEELLGGI
jgi:thymidylate synthase ThyX